MLNPIKQKSLRKILTTAPDDVLDLLSKIFIFDPIKRISAK